MKPHMRNMRSYGIALLMGLVLNTILRMYFPAQDSELSRASWNFSGELLELAKLATRFKPLGATFMAPFLNTVWAVGDRKARTQMQPALKLHKVDFDVERATILSKKLNGLLDSLREQIAAQEEFESAPAVDACLRSHAMTAHSEFAASPATMLNTCPDVLRTVRS